MRCGQVHSQARQLVASGQPTHLVAETLEISRSSHLYYRPAAAEAREPIVDTTRASSKVCGDKLRLRLSPRAVVAEGCGRPVREPQSACCASCASVACSLPQPAFPRHAQKGLEHGGSIPSQSCLAVRHDQALGRTYRGLGLSGFRAGLLYPREIVGWELSLRCRSQDALYRVASGHAPGFAAFRSS